MYRRDVGDAPQDVQQPDVPLTAATHPPDLRVPAGTAVPSRRGLDVRRDARTPPGARTRRPPSPHRFSAPVVRELPRPVPFLDDTVW
jgi:hypothetical protein